VHVDIVEVGLVVLGVDLALVGALVLVLDVADDQVPLVVSMYCFHRHSPVGHERRLTDRHWVNRTQPSPRHLNMQLVTLCLLLSNS